jgi:nucleotide-binding universal stress UspA family protein
MKKIIVATDYSAVASNAVHFGAGLARVFQAELVLFNVYHMSAHVGNALVRPEAIDHIIHNNEDHLKALTARLAGKYGVAVRWSSKMTNTADELERFAMAEHADLVVMGMEINLAEYKLFGNTTTNVIGRQKFPVLVVPKNVKFKGISKILYACESTFVSKDNRLDLLKEIARRSGARLQVLHVETKARAPVSAVNDQASAINSLMEGVDHTYTVINNPSIGHGIIQGIEAWQPDLLVMVPHKAGFLESVLKGSTTRKMTLITPVPLLVLPNP